MVRYTINFYHFSIVLDFTITVVAFLLAAILDQGYFILISRQYMFILLFLLLFISYITNEDKKNYMSNSIRTFQNIQVIILKILFLQITISIFFIFLIKEDFFTRNFLLLFFIISFGLLNIKILFFNKIFNLFVKNKIIENNLVIGSGEIGIKFYKDLKQYTNMKSTHYIEMNDNQKFTSRILDYLDNNKMRSSQIDNIFIVLPNTLMFMLEQIINLFNRETSRIYLIPDYLQFVLSKYKVEFFKGYPLFNIRNEPLSEIRWRFIKRTFDLLLSLIVCVFILSWFIPLSLLVLKMSNDRKLFFIQERLGQQNQIFKCYKIRTLKTEESQSFSPIKKNDERVTKLGRIYRKFNLDELPQFWNVLKGEMSIVGPRPIPIVFKQVYESYAKEIKIRSLVKPGLTGWAQVNGLRGDVEDPQENQRKIQKRIKYDIWYIENWTFMLDLQIIIMTIWKMLKGDPNAY